MAADPNRWFSFPTMNRSSLTQARSKWPRVSWPPLGHGGLRRVREWLASAGGRGFQTSFVFHVAILIGLSLMVFRPGSQGSGYGVSGEVGGAQGGGSGLENVI